MESVGGLHRRQSHSSRSRYLEIDDSKPTEGATTPAFRWRGAVAAIAEVLAILVVGSFAGRHLRRWIGLPAYKEVLGEGPAEQAPDFVWLSWITTVEMLTKFGAIVAVAFLVGWWLRRWTPKTYGLSLGGHRAGSLIVAGWVLFSLSFPVKLMLIINRHFPLGEGAAHFWVFDLDWTASFWLFAAVSSFLFPPFFEELIIRGCLQTRLIFSLGPRLGILLIGVIFAAAHGQYHRLDPLSIGLLLGLVYGSICLGYAFYRMGSLVPCIIAHALGNVPIAGVYEYALLAAMIVTVAIAWRPILSYARDFLRGTPTLATDLPVPVSGTTP